MRKLDRFQREQLKIIYDIIAEYNSRAETTPYFLLLS